MPTQTPRTPEQNPAPKPARRTHRRFRTPPLPQKNGIDPIQLVLPHLEDLPPELTPGGRAPKSIAEYLIGRFYPNEPLLFTLDLPPVRCV